MVEEMVVCKCWPLDRNMPAMTIEMVNLPVFGEGVRVCFPRFGFKQKEGKVAEDFVKSMEAEAWEIVGEMSDKEYLVRRAITDALPQSSF